MRTLLPEAFPRTGHASQFLRYDKPHDLSALHELLDEHAAWSQYPSVSHLLRNGSFLGDAVREKRVGDLILADVTYSANLRLPRHTHERPYVCLIRSGTYSERFGRRSRACEPAMVVYHPAGEHHCQEMHGSDVESFNVEIGPTWQHRMIEIGMAADQPVQFHGGTPQQIAVRMLEEFRHDDSGQTPTIENLFWELLAEIRSSTTPSPSGSGPAWLECVRQILHARLHEPLSLGLIADEFGIHPVHLAATFRRHFGCSVGEYLRRTRVIAAREMLENPDLPLTQIAIDTGFADQSHLTRTFKRLTGMTPGQYRTFLPFKTS
jgi:AraC family transcriptional regulator